MSNNPAKWTAPNYTSQSQSGTSYPSNIDAALAAAYRVANAFCPHQQDQGSPSPDLTVRIEAGPVFFNGTLTEVAAQTVSGFTTPSSGQHRVDRVVMDPTTGTCSRVAGTAATGSPSAVAPAITLGSVPICSVLITSADTAISNSMITDERATLSAAMDRLSTEQATTSGTVWDFTIPSGAKEIEVMFEGFSTNNTSALLVQLGDAGGVETSGYVSSAGNRSAEVGSTAGFILVTALVAAQTFSGVLRLTLKDSSDNTWVGAGTIVNTTSNIPHNSSGTKATSQELTTVRVTTVTPDTGDAGSVNVRIKR